MTWLTADDVSWSRARESRGVGALVLAGSSGRIDQARADVLARAGATALAIRWFGGERQPPSPREVALETFVEAIDLLAQECDRIGIVGLSYGAEAALLTCVRDARVDAVVAVAPTDVAWQGHHDSADETPRSKWTWCGKPVPFVPLDREWVPVCDPPIFTTYYQSSRQRADAAVVEAARIPVEDFGGKLVLVAGGDDQVWPSFPAAQAIVARRNENGRSTVLVHDRKAGHPVVLPGEVAGDLARRYAVGGDAGAPQRLGALAWPAICRVFGIGID